MNAAARSCLLATSLLIGATLGFTTAQTTYIVPKDHKTIQAAIDAARSKDKIVVGPGVYRETLDFKGKAIEVYSSHGPEQTVIDAGFRGSAVTFKNSEGPSTLLSGFTVMNGVGTAVGIFRHGGGIYCRNASPFLGNLILRSNLVYGLYAQGGGIYVEGGKPVIVSCSLDRNFAAHAGGGLYAVDATMIVTACRFSGNESSLGAGAFISGGSISLWNSSFLGNAADAGGGLYSNLNQAQIKNVVNNTFVGNQAKAFGGGIASASESLQIVNTILWDNRAPAGPELWLGRDCPYCVPSRVAIRYSIVGKGQKGVAVGAGSTLTWGKGILDQDPRLVDAAGGDVHLRHDSPGRNAGDKTASPLPAIDMEGDPRVLDSYPDLGADEWGPGLHGPIVAYRTGRLDQIAIGAPGGVAAWGYSLRALDPGWKIPGMGTLVIDPSAWQLVVLGVIPTSGVVPISLELPARTPVSHVWTQALVGPTLTNARGIQILDPPTP